MDFQEFGFWLDLAKRRKLEREADVMEWVRTAMWAEKNQFTALIHELRTNLLTPGDKRATQDEAWLALKTIGRA